MEEEEERKRRRGRKKREEDVKSIVRLHDEDDYDDALR